MAKIYPYKVFLLKQKIRSLELDLQDKIRLVEETGSTWFNRFTINQIKQEIVRLNIELANIYSND